MFFSPNSPISVNKKLLFFKESNKVNTTELEGGARMQSLQQNFIQQVNGQQFDGMKNVK
jgi:hypothetical protein